jgi:hypothetical protein
MKNFILVAAVVALTTAGTIQARAEGESNGNKAPAKKAYGNNPPAKKAYANKPPAKKAYSNKPPVKKAHATYHAAKPAVKTYAPPAKPKTYAPPAKPKAYAPAKVAKAPPAPYYKSKAVKYEGGYYYSGRNHSHWSETCCSSTYNTTIYKDPGLNVWYSWNETEKRYYPVDSGK